MMKSPLALMLSLGLNAQASSNVKGQEFNYTSPNGVVEKCVITDRIPEGKYSDDDLKEEEKFCKLDYYATNVAFCGKTWSTSAATIIKSLDNQELSQKEAEQITCALGKQNPLKTIAKFKQTVSNSSGASGLFSLSSLMYYHLSRYLDTTIDVPTAVLRTMDKDMYLERIASKARPTATMNIRAWAYMNQTSKNPQALKPDERDDLFTPDLKQIYGVMLKDKGERYGAEINSARKTSGYTEQNQEIQNTTPTFLALRSSGTIHQAIQSGVEKALKDPNMKPAFSGTPSTVQMILWMNEMSEMAVLDYMLSQQDRVGNIDFRWYFMFVDSKGITKKAKVDSEFTLSRKAGFMANLAKEYKADDNSDIASDARMYQAIKKEASGEIELIQKTMIGDNDAGGRAFANFTKKAEYIQKFQHLNPDLYKQVLKLDADFKAQGPVATYFKEALGLKHSEAALLARNTGEVADILKGKCKAGTLKFDLVSHKKALKNEFTEETLNCENP